MNFKTYPLISWEDFFLKGQNNRHNQIKCWLDWRHKKELYSGGVCRLFCMGMLIVECNANNCRRKWTILLNQSDWCSVSSWWGWVLFLALFSCLRWRLLFRWLCHIVWPTIILSQIEQKYEVCSSRRHSSWGSGRREELRPSINESITLNATSLTVGIHSEGSLASNP